MAKSTKYSRKYQYVCLFVYLMVFNTTFNNIPVIAWWSISLVEETGGPGEIQQHIVVHRALIEIRTHNMTGNSR